MVKHSAIPFLCFTFLVASQAAFSQASKILPFQNTELSTEQRVNDLVGRMTLDEKIGQMMHAAPAIERLGMPEYN